MYIRKPGYTIINCIVSSIILNYLNMYNIKLRSVLCKKSLKRNVKFVQNKKCVHRTRDKDVPTFPPLSQNLKIFEWTKSDLP